MLLAKRYFYRLLGFLAVVVGLELLVFEPFNHFKSVNSITQSFQQTVDSTLPPTSIQVTTKSESIWEDKQPAGSYYDQYISQCPEYGTESDYAKRRNFAEILKDALIQNYIRPTSLMLDRISNPKFLQYSCEPSELCGGAGDRMRGVLSSLYLAYASGRIFHINWKRNNDLEDYFRINYLFYNVSKSTYSEKLNNSNSTVAYTERFMDIQNELKFLKWAASSEWLQKINGSTMVSIYSNSLIGIEGVLSNPNFKNSFEKLTLGFMKQPVDMSVFVSAGLRVLFSNPVERLRELFEKCVASTFGKDQWENVVKIGTQVRSLHDWKDHGSRLTTRGLQCFVEKTVELAEQYGNGKSVIIFVTGDDMNSTQYVIESLQKRNVTVFSEFDKCGMLNLQHFDKDQSPSIGDNWLQGADPYLAWLTLTKMDHLVISRSSFSELASFYSLVPTYRYRPNSYCKFNLFNMIGPHIRLDWSESLRPLALPPKCRKS